MNPWTAQTIGEAPHSLMVVDSFPLRALLALVTTARTGDWAITGMRRTLREA